MAVLDDQVLVPVPAFRCPRIIPSILVAPETNCLVVMDEIVGALLLVDGFESSCRVSPVVGVLRAVVDLAAKDCPLQPVDTLGRVVVHLQMLEDEPGSTPSRSYRHARPPVGQRLDASPQFSQVSYASSVYLEL